MATHNQGRSSRNMQKPTSVPEAAKGGFPHFMLKEIYEQPAALRRLLAGCLEPAPEEHNVRLR
ncbi:MAG TPA: hypothetical protein VE998_07280, partial [Terriglobales bacterium]|nr:hypothetical protein [Terriglobales bacterium]